MQATAADVIQPAATGTACGGEEKAPPGVMSRGAFYGQTQQLQLRLQSLTLKS